MSTTIRAALTKRLMPESYFHIIEGEYLSVAIGYHKGKRVLIPGIGFRHTCARIVTYLKGEA